jgi:uncharacterized protein YjgD (DUF1641 family)
MKSYFLPFNPEREESLLVHAANSKYKESVEFLIEFIAFACFENSSEVISNFLRFYLSTSYDKFDILNIIHETLNVNLVEEILKTSNDLLSYLSKRHPNNCLKYINFLMDNFANNSDLLKDVPKTKNEIELFLSNNLSVSSTTQAVRTDQGDMQYMGNHSSITNLQPMGYPNIVIPIPRYDTSSVDSKEIR